MTWELLIPVIAAGLSLIAIGIELLTHDREKARDIEFAIRRKQREIKKYQKEKDTKAMMSANKELMGLMGKNFRLRMKTMFISFPLFLIIFWILSGMLSVSPLYAGEISQLGINLRNLQNSHQNVTLEFVSSDIQVLGGNSQSFDLNDKGDQGDRQTVLWNVTSSEGLKQYSVRITSENKSSEKNYSINFVDKGSLSPGFSPSGVETTLAENLDISPFYKSVEVNIFGLTISWFWYYFISYLILGALLSPVKNRLLWGHWKGVGHLEKLESEKNEATKE